MIRRSLRNQVLIAVILGGAPACSEAPPVTAETDSLIVRDSAGIEIVEVPGSALETLPRWHLSTEPVLSIGAVEGEAPYLFSRVGSATRLASGEIVVADGQSRQLRVFGADGAFLRAVGRDGEGPGEFRSLARVSSPEGSMIAVFDVPLARVTVLDLGDASHVTRPQRPDCWEDPPADGGRCEVVGLFPDGTALARNWGEPPPPVELTGAIQVVHGPEWTIGPISGDTLAGSVRAQASTAVRVMEPEFFSGTGLFEPGDAVSLGASGFAIWDPRAAEFRAYAQDGALERVTRILAPPQAVTEALLDEYRTWADTTSTRARDISQAYLAALQPEGTVPHFGEIELDRAGRIWARVYRPFWAFGPQPADVWTVFDTGGIPVAMLEGGFPGDVFEIGADYALVHATDDLGVEYVRMYSLTLEGGG